MDSAPSFSLGLTQIQSTSNEINVSGFVPGDFDYKYVGFHENRSKYRNDPTIMKKLWDAASVKGKKTASVKGKKTIVASSKGKNDVVKRDPLPQGMKYVIKTVLHHPLSGLNCTSNIEDFQYSTSDGSVLMTKYFPVAKNRISKKKFVQWYKMGNFDNDQDALQMTILFFIHAFLLSEIDDAAVSYIEFNMVADGRYEQYPWEKISFNKLMNSLRQDFFVEKQLYRLGGMPYVLNIWMYKCCSEVDKDIACRIGNGIPRICNWFVVGTKPKFKKFMNGMFSKYVYTNISPTVDELKCLQLPNHDGMDLKDSVNSTLPSTSCRQLIKVDQKDQEKIKCHPSVKEVNKAPSGTSNTITDPINEEAPYEPSLMDFGKQTPIAEQNQPAVESVCESTQKNNVSGGTYHEQVLMKVDMNAIESLVKTYVIIETDSPNKDVEKNEPHGDDLGTPKEHPKDIPEMNDDGNDVYTGDKKRDENPSNESSHKFNFDDPAFRRQTIEVQNVQKESETEVKNAAFQHSINNTIDDFSSSVSAIQSEELLQKENLPDLILPTNNTGVQNELQLYLTICIFQVSCTVISFEAFQEMIDNIITDMSTPIIAVAVNSEDFSKKANLPDPSLQTANVEVPNEMREFTNVISTDSSQESIDNIIAGISTPVVAMKMKSVSPTEMNDNECQIHGARFQSDLPEVELGKKSATVDFPQKHQFDGYLISDEMPMGLIEEYFDWIVEGLLKFHEKKKLKDNHYKANKSGISFSSLDFVIAQPDSKNWFYTMSQPNTCWNDKHVDVIFYYLRKKSKQQKDQEYRYTTVNCLFKTYIDVTYKHYIEDAAGDSLSTQDDYKKMSFVASNEGALINIIKGFNIPVALPWHLVDEPSHEIKRLSVMLPTYISYSGLLENTERTVWSSLEAYEDKMSKVAGDLNDTPFDVEYIEDIAQQVSESLYCGVFVAAYAEFLSDQM
ncbi:hypothetical protein FXO37_26453 [Capsicum annuum]|nr:hypothetical protein FXO37_26453 [Capsicum annuum]